ncbi:MAG: YfiR family protein [Desulfobacteraceae bacterium]|nr:YfiR family protein [Desulfobacteraceae bacterium]MBC2757490.1 YfiR family protein [Desulfobacteraceae bacterium]
MKKMIRLKCSLIFIIIAFMVFSGTGYCLEGMEYQIKGAMMMNFIKFVKWPDQLIDKTGATITIGIIGKDNFGNTLDHIEGRSIGGKQLAIRHINSLSQLSDCQVLFVGTSESHRCYQILREVSGTPVLTIGEDEDFIRMGGIIRFYNEKNHIRFEINQTAALKSDLKLSAKLLEVAAAIQ